MTRNAQILRAFVVVALLLLVSRALGAFREIVLAARFGTSATMDAYLFMLNLANWPVAVWFSALTVVAVPLLVRERTASPREVQQFAFELCLVSLMVGTLLAAFYAILLPQLAGWSSIGLSAAAAEVVALSSVWMSLLVPLGMLISVLSVGFLASRKHANTLFEGIPALVVALAALSLLSPSAAVVLWSTVLGFLAQTVALVAFLPREWTEIPLRAQVSSRLWRPFLRAFSLVAVSQLITSSTIVVDQLMIAGLGVGALAVLGFANRILALLLGLGATAVSRATLSTFAAIPVDDARELYVSARLWMGWLFAIGATGALLGWIASPWIVQILFERGMFGPNDTAAVSTALRFGLLQLPFYLSGIVAVQVLAVRGRYDRIAQVGLTNLAVKVGANLLLIEVLGVAGAMLATALMYAVAFPMLIMVTFPGVFVRKSADNPRGGQATGGEN